VGVINRQGCEILGYLPEEVVGRNWFDHFLPERVREEVRAVFSGLIAGEIELVRVHENPVLNASGQEREIEWRNSALYDEDGRIRNIISSGTDITDRQDLEKQLRQAQKMEAIGRLAGGIAHDFNNLLTVITGNVELARAEREPARIDSRLETIADASRTAAELTTQLLTFSSRQPVIPVLTLLDRAITESMRILSRTVGEDIVVRIEHREPDLPVMIDPAQLSQILMNLVLNARDAMPAGGALTITTSQVELTAEHVAAGGIAAPGTFARLAVTDTGLGMDDEQKARLFEPFFTTKELGKGTGLGMATVYGIVNQNAGFIKVESAPGTGTTVSVFLPRAAYEPSPAGSTDEVGMIPGGSERIVLVEDDAAVRDLAVEILTEKGYTVMTFTDPEKALEAFAGMTAETLPDLLITDVVMPRMSGVELVRRFEEMDCRPRVLLISGYTDDALARRGFSGEHYELLNKPFTTRQLCARVRELLDR
jgi:two-component system cell cycle sensor histidine kinase/response regulator CckA